MPISASLQTDKPVYAPSSQFTVSWTITDPDLRLTVELIDHAGAVVASAPLDIHPSTTVALSNPNDDPSMLVLQVIDGAGAVVNARLTIAAGGGSATGITPAV